MHDNAYCQVVFDGYEAPSFLAAEGVMDIGIELYSHSKTYNMTGWRVGFAAGNKDLVKDLDKVKSNIDTGTFDAVQLAGAAAMNASQACVDETNEVYRERRDTLIEGLKSMGLEAKPQKATFYIWAPGPEGFTSIEFAGTLLEEAGIVAIPGVGFGDAGEGFIRFALTQTVERIQEAVERMKKLQF